MPLNKQEGLDPARCATTTYQVNLHSVVATLDGGFFEGPVDYDAFDEAQEHAVEALEHGITMFAWLVKQLKAANRFEDLDLCCNESLLTRTEYGQQLRLFSLQDLPASRA